MSYSRMQAMDGQQFTHCEPTPAQLRLRSLVQELEWSYVALWGFDPQTRKLGWKGGHWRQNDTHGWNHEQYFSAAFKPSQFGTGYGSVGLAFAKGGNIWMRDSSFLDKAGSKEQFEFLQRARISTAIFIPWSEGVLELGTCDNVPENSVLMERIRRHFMTIILPTLDQQGSVHLQLPASNVQTEVAIPPAPLSFPPSRVTMPPSSYASLSPLRHQLSDNLSAHSFEPNSLNQQIHRRSASVSDMFLGAAEGKEDMNTDHVLLPGADAAARAMSWGLPTLTTTAGALQTPMSNAMYYSSVQEQTFRSRSGTTSSSVSSIEEAASTRLSGDSPEQSVFVMVSSQRQPSHSNTSFSPRRGTSSHSPELNQLEDTIGSQTLRETQESRVEDDLHQLDPFLMLDSGPLESGSYNFPSLETGTMSPMSLLAEATNGNPSPSPSNGSGTAYNGPSSYELPQPGPAWPSPVPTQGPFKAWRRNRIQAQPMRKKSQDLLRRCIDMVKQIPHANPPAATTATMQNEAQPAMHNNVGLQRRRGSSSSSPETVNDGIPNDPFDQIPPRVQRRPRQGPRISSMGAAVHHGHDEAALNHMMAERRRRVKQKENFAALRRLVPIISKADKASILGDAIVYLKDLESQIAALEASKAESERQVETLQNSYKDLEQRNRELESMALPNRMHSM